MGEEGESRTDKYRNATDARKGLGVDLSFIGYIQPAFFLRHPDEDRGDTECDSKSLQKNEYRFWVHILWEKSRSRSDSARYARA